MPNAKRRSAGLLLYRLKEKGLELFLVHPGGPFWQGKEEGAWSVPKGEPEDGEEPLAAAKREFREETGSPVEGPFIELTPIVQKGGKTVHAWAVAGNIDAETITCNTFKAEWPPKSGRWQSFPEVDKAAWFSIAEARKKINPAQVAFIEELVTKLDAKKETPGSEQSVA